jgi:hypothetical protein
MVWYGMVVPQYSYGMGVVPYSAQVIVLQRGWFILFLDMAKKWKEKQQSKTLSVTSFKTKCQQL